MSAEETAAGTFTYGGRTYEYASFGRRLGAASLDTLFWLVAWMFVPADSMSETAVAITGFVFLTLWFNYFAVCEWKFGQTIGKNILGLRVMALDGGDLGYNDAAIRNLLRLVDAPLALIGVDYLIVRGSPRRQRLGDRAADTIVVREPEKAPAFEAAAGPAAHSTGPPGPTSSELFGDATAAMAAGAPPPRPSAPAPQESQPAPQQVQGSPAPPRTAFASLTWGPGLGLLGVLGAIVAGIFIGIPVLVFDPDAGSDEGSVGANIAVQLATVIGFLAVPLYIAARDAPGFRVVAERLGLRRFRPSAFGWMALAYFAYLVFAAVYTSIVGTPEQEDIADFFGPLATQIFLIVICASVAEEVCFRGFLYGGMRTAIPPIPAAIASGLVFGALHAITGLSAVPVLVGLGIALALLYEKTGSIVPGIILHAINNSLALAVA